MIKLAPTLKLICITLFALSLILQSCSIEKRHYRPGYNIEWKSRSSLGHNNQVKPEQVIVDANSSTEASANNSPEQNSIAIASGLAQTPDQIPDFYFAPKKNALDGDGCDRIYLLNGKIIKSRISSDKDTMIRYVTCDSLSGKEYAINKKEIKAIKYASGKYEVINTIKYENEEKFIKVDPQKTTKEDNELNSGSKAPVEKAITYKIASAFALVAVIFFVLGLAEIGLIFVLAGLVFAIVGKHRDLRKLFLILLMVLGVAAALIILAVLFI
jgi:hypothetical protein